MTTTPFDDPTAYDARWGRLNESQRRLAADADPLLFLADHVSVGERVAGTVVIHVRLTDPDERMAMIVDGGPTDPDEADCIGLIVTALSKLGAGDPFDDGQSVVTMEGATFPPDAFAPPRCPVLEMGLIIHRDGPAEIDPIDRVWAEVLDTIAEIYEFTSLGVVTRTRCGAIVRMPPR